MVAVNVNLTIYFTPVLIFQLWSTFGAVLLGIFGKVR